MNIVGLNHTLGTTISWLLVGYSHYPRPEINIKTINIFTARARAQLKIDTCWNEWLFISGGLLVSQCSLGSAFSIVYFEESLYSVWNRHAGQLSVWDATPVLTSWATCNSPHSALLILSSCWIYAFLCDMTSILKKLYINMYIPRARGHFNVNTMCWN